MYRLKQIVILSGAYVQIYALETLSGDRAQELPAPRSEKYEKGDR